MGADGTGWRWDDDSTMLWTDPGDSAVGMAGAPARVTMPPSADQLDPDRPFFATAAKGTEGALRDELRELRLPKVRADRGGVHFGGEIGHAMRACLRSRIAMRVLWRQAVFPAPDGDALYDGTRTIDWSEWVDPSRTVGVQATVKDGSLRHTGFVAQRIKDAVVDQQREKQGDRPDVSRDDPDIRIVAHVDRDVATISIDLAGNPLSQRGYRTEGGEAPLRESLAAAVLRLGGYRPGVPLIDPMCGSGTLAIEAALWAAAIPPGQRRSFGFERWRSFGDDARAALRLEKQRAKDFARPVESSARGTDRDRRAVARARQNAQRAGAPATFGQAEIGELPPGEPGTFVVTNPPYGVRLEDDREWIDGLHRLVGDTPGCTLVIITPERDLPRELGVRPTREHALWNGPLECRLYTWET